MHLTEMLRSKDRQDFNSALEDLVSMPKNESIQILEQLSTAHDGAFRSRALDGMAKISPKRAESLAIQFLQDAEWFVRVDAINTLCRLHSRAAAPSIAKLLASDSDELVRSWAAFALGRLADTSVIPVLQNAVETDVGTNHEGVPIRETAVESIRMIRSRHAEEESM